MTFVAKQDKHSSPYIFQEETLSWKEEFVCVGFVWFCGVFFTNCLPSRLESQSFNCKNECSWIELLMSSSLIFMHPLRINKQCSFQRLPVPYFSGYRSSIHECQESFLGCSIICSLKFASLLLQSLQWLLGKTSLQIWWSGKYASLMAPYPEIHCLSQYVLSFQNNSRLQRRWKQREVRRFWCVSSFSTSYRYFSILHEKPACQAYNWRRHLQPRLCIAPTINTCMALLRSEPGHISFWVKRDNHMTSVRNIWTCKLVAKGFELSHDARSNRNSKQRVKNLFHYSSMELPTTCNLFKLTHLLLDQMLSNTGKCTGNK